MGFRSSSTASLPADRPLIEAVLRTTESFNASAAWRRLAAVNRVPVTGAVEAPKV
jgi:hypothetical protein